MYDYLLLQMWVLVQASLVNAMERVFEVEWLKITLAIATLDSRELIVNWVNELYDSWYIYKILNNTMDRYIYPAKNIKTYMNTSSFEFFYPFFEIKFIVIF